MRRSVAASSTPSQNKKSEVSKVSVLPPITPTLEGNIATPVPPPPPSPTDLTPNFVTDDNVDAFSRKKVVLLKYLMGAADLMEEPSKYNRFFGALPHGCEPSVTPARHNRLKIYSALADNGQFPFVIAYWNKLNVNDSSQWLHVAGNNSVASRLLNFLYLILPMWNGTDLGDVAYSRKFDESLRAFYLKLLALPIFQKFIDGSEMQSAFHSALLGTLHNLVHRYAEGSSQVRDGDGVRIVSPYMLHPDLLIKTKAILVMCYIVSESESKNLVVTEDHVEFIVEVLRDCIGSPDHCSRAFGYDAEEMLDGLNRMAVADSNKEAIVKCGALPLYAQLLNDDAQPSEQAGACRGLWTLAFNEKNKEKILAQGDCMQGLRKLCSSSNANVKRAAEGALWVIEGENKRREHQTLQAAAAQPPRIIGKPRGHLMISYNWGIQSEVIQVKDRLRAAGYEIWIDVEQMSGSTLDAMASAIENSAAVIIFFTEQYKNSPSCRSEAEYCYKMHKPFIPVRMQRKYIADGWLGMILGTRFFPDFTKGEFEVTFMQLCKEIEGVIKGESTPNAGAETDQIFRSTALALRSARRRHAYDETDAVKDSLDNLHLASSTWTESDVKSWLHKNGLDNVCDRFHGFTGMHITELRHAFSLAPDFFYKALRQDLGLPLKEALALAKVIRELV